MDLTLKSHHDRFTDMEPNPLPEAKEATMSTATPETTDLRAVDVETGHTVRLHGFGRTPRSFEVIDTALVANRRGTLKVWLRLLDPRTGEDIDRHFLRSEGVAVEV